MREREDGHDQYEVKLTKADGGPAEVELALDGTITQLEEVIAATALPEPVAKAFAAKYPGVAVGRAERITRPGKPEQFELKLEGRKEEVTFSATGELIEVEGGDATDDDFTTTTIALPGGSADGVAMDYLLYNPRTHAVWVPAGNTGSVDVIDTASGKVTRIEGFATQEMERRGMKRTVGPSSATLGDAGTVYVGNRGDSTICAVDEKALAKRTCGKLDSMPDGIAFVAKTHEVWVTTPRDKSIRILDATTLAQKVRLPFEGEPEGFAVDNAHNRFYTNLEDKDSTLAIALDTHATVATWQPKCGEDGPHGLRFVDGEARLLVACSAELRAIDTATGTVVGTLAVDDGVDDLDYDAATHRVYAGGGKSGALAIATLAPTGALTLRTHVPTRPGARNGVVADGSVYLSHAKGSEIVVVAPAKKH